MAVYVDNFRTEFHGRMMCHMLADSIDELHAMADLLGLRREWFQGHSTPHYDICQVTRKKAVQFGAVEASRPQVVSLIRRYRLEKINKSK